MTKDRLIHSLAKLTKEDAYDVLVAAAKERERMRQEAIANAICAFNTTLSILDDCGVELSNFHGGTFNRKEYCFTDKETGEIYELLEEVEG